MNKDENWADADKFWKDHDPTPDTPENEFQDIYIKLVEFANNHFKEALLSGALSDRGRILIVYGPPDEVVEEPIYMDYMTDNVYDNITHRTEVKSVIVWYYDKPANQRYTYEFTGRVYSSMFFKFGDMEGYGTYSLIDTNVDEEIIDLRAWQ